MKPARGAGSLLMKLLRQWRGVRFPPRAAEQPCSELLLGTHCKREGQFPFSCSCEAGSQAAVGASNAVQTHETVPWYGKVEGHSPCYNGVPAAYNSRNMTLISAHCMLQGLDTAHPRPAKWWGLLVMPFGAFLSILWIAGIDRRGPAPSLAHHHAKQVAVMGVVFTGATHAMHS